MFNIINYTLIYISAIVLCLMLILSRVFNHTGLFVKKGHESFVWKIMHFLGGFFVAMFWSGVTASPLLIISLALTVGVAWEVWECFYGSYKLRKTGNRKYLPQIPDTIHDLIMDTIGAIVWVSIITF